LDEHSGQLSKTPSLGKTLFVVNNNITTQHQKQGPGHWRERMNPAKRTKLGRIPFAFFGKWNTSPVWGGIVLTLAYLELVQRRGAFVATFDAQLAEASAKEGVSTIRK